MKKIIALAMLMLALCFMFVACDDDEEDDGRTAGSVQTGGGSEVFIVDFEDLYPSGK